MMKSGIDKATDFEKRFENIWLKTKHLSDTKIVILLKRKPHCLTWKDKSTI